MAPVILTGLGTPPAGRAFGRHLYLTGATSTVDEQGEIVYHGLGLTLVDLDPGRIVAEAVADAYVSAVQPAPDGRSVYVFGSATGAVIVPPDAPYLLRRLDVASLRVLATRSASDVTHM